MLSLKIIIFIFGALSKKLVFTKFFKKVYIIKMVTIYLILAIFVLQYLSYHPT